MFPLFKTIQQAAPHRLLDWVRVSFGFLTCWTGPDNMFQAFLGGEKSLKRKATFHSFMNSQCPMCAFYYLLSLQNYNMLLFSWLVELPFAECRGTRAMHAAKVNTLFGEPIFQGCADKHVLPSLSFRNPGMTTCRNFAHTLDKIKVQF